MKVSKIVEKSPVVFEVFNTYFETNAIEIKKDGQIYLYGQKSDFYLQEFIPREIYEEYGIRSCQLIDVRMFIVAQFIRELLGCPVLINDWMWGGTTRNYCGLRTQRSKHWSALSRHCTCAFDCIFKAITSEQARKIIFGFNRSTYNKIVKKDTGKRNIIFSLPYKIVLEIYKLIGGIELKVKWLHVDLRFTNNEGILKFDPPKKKELT